MLRTAGGLPALTRFWIVIRPLKGGPVCARGQLKARCRRNRCNHPHGKVGLDVILIGAGIGAIPGVVGVYGFESASLRSGPNVD